MAKGNSTTTLWARSYEVRTEKGQLLRRNRRMLKLIKTNEIVATEEESEEEEFEEEHEEQNEGVEEEQEEEEPDEDIHQEAAEKEEEKKTRSGRVIQLPTRFKDYDMS